MSQGHVEATRPLVWTDAIIIVQHQFWGHFVSATCRTEFNLLNFVEHVAGTKRCKDAMTLRVDGYATCPCNRILIWANQRQRSKLFALVHRKKQDGCHQKRKLLVILMMIIDDEAVLVLLLGFHHLLVACPIELDYPWNEQSAYVLGFYSKESDRYLYDSKLVNIPQPIRIGLRWPPFYFNNSVPQSMLVITITRSQFTRGDVSLQHIPGTYPRNIFMFVKMLWFCPCYMSPLHVPVTCPSVCNTNFCRCCMSLRHVPPTWSLMSAHL